MEIDPPNEIPMKSILMFAALILSTPAFAAKVAVSPVILRAADTETTQPLQLHNLGDAPAIYQVQAFEWTQKDGVDQLTPTRALMASPAMLEIAPGAKRVIRVVKLTPGSGYFRLLLREVLPPATKPGVRQATDFKLAVAFEPDAGHAQLSATTRGNAIVITNAGNKAARLTSIGPLAGKPWKTGALGWVLPGGSLVFPYQATGQIALTVNGQPLTLTVQ